MTGYLELLKEELGEGEHEEHLSPIFTASKRMLTLIDNLERFTNLEEKELKMTSCSSAEICELAWGHALGKWQVDDADFSTTGVASLEGDAKWLLTLFEEVFLNALAYRGSKPAQVKVEVRSLDERRQTLVPNRCPLVVFAIRDEGRGIAPEDLKKVFLPTYRVMNPGEVKGQGLGLSLARKVAEFCGGTLTLESELGRATTVYATFPKHQVDRLRSSTS